MEGHLFRHRFLEELSLSLFMSPGPQQQTLKNNKAKPLLSGAFKEYCRPLSPGNRPSCVAALKTPF